MAREPVGVAPLGARAPSRLLLAAAIMAREHCFVWAQDFPKRGHRSMDLLMDLPLARLGYRQWQP